MSEGFIMGIPSSEDEDLFVEIAMKTQNDPQEYTMTHAEKRFIKYRVSPDIVTCKRCNGTGKTGILKFQCKECDGRGWREQWPDDLRTSEFKKLFPGEE